MWNFAYMQKKIISASIKTTNQTFTFVSSKVVNKHLASTTQLGNEVSTALKYSVSPLENCACSRSNGGATLKFD